MPAASKGKQAGGKFRDIVDYHADWDRSALADVFADALGHVHVEISPGFGLKEWGCETEAAVWFWFHT